MTATNIDGNLAALARYERELDRFQMLDDMLDEAVAEIYDTPAWLEEVIREADDDMDIEDAVEEAAREYIAEQQRIKHECFPD